jgi:phage-related protein
MADWDNIYLIPPGPAVNPDRYFSSTIEAGLLEVRFGDGYSQRISAGINPIIEKWDLAFKNKTYAQGRLIENFLRHREGRSFTWKPPGRAETRVICKAWRLETINYGLTDSSGSFCTVTATFEQVYE